MEQIFNFQEQTKYVAWESRQRMKRLEGLKEPFVGFFEGRDLWPDGVPKKYFDVTES